VSLLYYFAIFALVITIVVFVHEYGHYIVARICGVRVEEFSIGFGKKLFGIRDKNGTMWKFCAIPMGGYVKMHGDIDPASAMLNDDAKKSDANLNLKEAFFAKNLWQKSAIVLAGPVANFLLAMVILTIVTFIFGVMVSGTKITHVEKNMPAYNAGVEVNDKIIAIDGSEVSSMQEVEMLVSANPDISIKFTLDRGGKKLDLDLTPKAVDMGNFKKGMIGIASNEVSWKKVTIFEAIYKAYQDCFAISKLTLQVLGQMLTGKRGTDDLGGPVMIAKTAGDAASLGFFPLLWFIAMISLNLGIMNLLPIPVLDGGHLAFYVVEAIAGKKFANKVHNYAARIGFAILILLTIFIFIKDIIRLF
jgi:regulator of sigma E protease